MHNHSNTRNPSPSQTSHEPFPDEEKSILTRPFWILLSTSLSLPLISESIPQDVVRRYAKIAVAPVMMTPYNHKPPRALADILYTDLLSQLFTLESQPVKWLLLCSLPWNVVSSLSQGIFYAWWLKLHLSELHNS